MLCIFIEYSIDAAHWLPNVPEGHKCGKMHGHRYDIRIEISGEPDEKTGWIVDYAEAKSIIDPFIESLDHQTLNHVRGLENPTCENITLWIRDQLVPLTGKAATHAFSRIEVRETGRAGVVWIKERTDGLDT